MTSTKRIHNVAIIGGGLMGTGIAEVAALSGFTTLLIKGSGGDPAPTRARVETSIAKGVERGKLTPEQAEDALARLTVTADRSGLASADLVIESIIEDLPTKQALFGELVGRVPEHCILASNTSTLRISELAPEGAADRTIGLHFFSPVPAMKLVEVAYMDTTRPELLASAKNFVEALGKTPIPVVDSCGFIVNRLLVPYLVGAIAAYSQGLAPAQHVDEAMRLGCGHPVGPLMLCDLIGLDIVYAMAKLLYHEFGDDRFRPPALLRRLVQDGMLGKKSGIGFYDYSQRPPVPNASVWKLISEGELRTPSAQLAS
jgi:3-hydroxybutyryl-CoA dehydrogenase